MLRKIGFRTLHQLDALGFATPRHLDLARRPARRRRTQSRRGWRPRWPRFMRDATVDLARGVGQSSTSPAHAIAQNVSHGSVTADKTRDHRRRGLTPAAAQRSAMRAREVERRTRTRARRLHISRCWRRCTAMPPSARETPGLHEAPGRAGPRDNSARAGRNIPPPHRWPPHLGVRSPGRGSPPCGEAGMRF